MEMDTRNSNNIPTVESQIALNIEKPKKILHFSDGTLEEFSDDELDGKNSEKNEQENKIVESELTWGPWFVHKTIKTGKKILAGCDYLGENLASILGITTPKYSSEIEEYRRTNEENKRIIEKDKLENASWQETKPINDAITKEMIDNNHHKQLNDKF